MLTSGEASTFPLLLENNNDVVNDNTKPEKNKLQIRRGGDSLLEASRRRDNNGTRGESKELMSGCEKDMMRV